MSLLALQAMGGPPRPIPGTQLVRMPRELPWIAGASLSIYWKGLIHLRSLTGYTFTIAGPGVVQSDRWYWDTPTVGTHRLTISVWFGGALVARGTTTLRVLSATGASGTVKVNLTGDSITAAAGSGAYPNVVKSLLGSAGLTATLHGSQTASGADAGVVQEGHPGWAYATFLTDPSSPYASGGAAYALAQGGPFTDVALMLGTNDMSGLGGSEVNWPTYAEDVADDATALLAIVRAGSPSARVHISLVYDFSDDVADWADADTLDAYYRRHRLVSDALYRRFAARENESLYVLATHVLLDPAGDFDANNVHPNAAGHARIGRAVAASILRRAAA